MASLHQLYTREELAEKFKVNPRTIDRWRREGKIKGRKVGSTVRFTAAEARKLMESDPFYKVEPKRKKK